MILLLFLLIFVARHIILRIAQDNAPLPKYALYVRSVVKYLTYRPYISIAHAPIDSNESTIGSMDGYLFICSLICIHFILWHSLAFLPYSNHHLPTYPPTHIPHSNTFQHPHPYLHISTHIYTYDTRSTWARPTPGEETDRIRTAQSSTTPRRAPTMSAGSG